MIEYSCICQEVLDEYIELPTTLDHDQTLLNQSDEPPAPPQTMT